MPAHHRTAALQAVIAAALGGGRTRRRTTSLAALAFVVLAPSAVAGELSVHGGVMRYVAAPGETNKVSVHHQEASSFLWEETPARFVVFDSAPLSVGPGCHLGAEGRTAWCPADEVQEIRGSLGDGDDEADYQAQEGDTRPQHWEGGPGNDFILAGGTVLGQEGNDRVRGDHADGGPGDDLIYGSQTMIGGEGNDYLKGEASVVGAASGGPGDDVIDLADGRVQTISCGPGTDAVHVDGASFGLIEGGRPANPTVRDIVDPDCGASPALAMATSSTTIGRFSRRLGVRVAFTCSVACGISLETQRTLPFMGSLRMTTGGTRRLLLGTRERVPARTTRKSFTAPVTGNVVLGRHNLAVTARLRVTRLGKRLRLRASSLRTTSVEFPTPRWVPRPEAGH
jgi:hypothetical protein